MTADAATVREALKALDDLLVRAEAAEREVKELRERDDWLIRQLDNAIVEADAVAFACGLATARALLGDLRNTRAALAGKPKP